MGILDDFWEILLADHRIQVRMRASGHQLSEDVMSFSESVFRGGMRRTKSPQEKDKDAHKRYDWEKLIAQEAPTTSFVASTPAKRLHRPRWRKNRAKRSHQGPLSTFPVRWCKKRFVLSRFKLLHARNFAHFRFYCRRFPQFDNQSTQIPN